MFIFISDSIFVANRLVLVETFLLFNFFFFKENKNKTKQKTADIAAHINAESRQFWW